MPSKTRAVTIALALTAGLGIPATMAMAPSMPEMPSTEPTSVQPSESPSPVIEASTEAPTPVQPVVTDMPEPTPTPEPTETEVPDMVDDRPMEEWEPESAPWEWSQLLPDEAYVWPRCEDFYQTDCVWVASEHKVQGAAESFIALGDGDVIPLNESQALVMVGG